MLDTTALEALGYAPRTDTAAAVASTCAWLRDIAQTGPWQARFPVLAAYPFDLFDYGRRDAWLASLAARGRCPADPPRS